MAATRRWVSVHIAVRRLRWQGVAILAAVAVIAGSGATPLASSSAAYADPVTPTSVPEPWMWASPSGGYGDQTFVYSDTPEFAIAAYDGDVYPEVPTNDLPNYRFEMEIWSDADPATELTSASVEAERAGSDPYAVTAEWIVPQGTLELGDEFKVRLRTTWGEGATAVVGAWSGWNRVKVITRPPTPTLLVPEAGAIVRAPVTFSASTEGTDWIGGEDATISISVRDAVTQNFVWRDDLTADEDGHVEATMNANLPAGAYEWSAEASSHGAYSESTDWRGFTLERAPSRPTWTWAGPQPGGALVTFAGAVSAGINPILDYTITANPGGHTVTVPATEYQAFIPLPLDE